MLKVVCWSSQWSRVRATLDQLGIVLDAGLVVRVKGAVQLYKPRGDISFILSELDTDALLGKVAAERARLIKALVDEGLFDRNRRIPAPRLPLTLERRRRQASIPARPPSYRSRVPRTRAQGRLASRSLLWRCCSHRARTCARASRLPTRP